MREAERIAEQLRRAHEGGAWHGPAVDELLKGVTAEQAAARAAEGAHSISELVAHVEAWERAVLRRLSGDAAQIYMTEEDWSPTAGPSEEAWAAARRRLTETYLALREAVLALDDARLDEPILPNMSTVYVSLHGVIQHTLYHAGQIALARRALGLQALTIDSDTAGTI
jgi:uncharacterized damage-inducible protein DinB